MFISEIYPCIQGEGRLAGTPSILVRTSGCNLRCKWGETLCDTPFTSWNAEGTQMTVEEIAQKVRTIESEPFADPIKTNMVIGGITYRPDKMNHVIISGGEPTIQKAELIELCKHLKRHGDHITVETNGTAFVDCRADLMSISPKLSSSIPVGTEFEGMHGTGRINLDALIGLLTGYDSYLKFVVMDETDLNEILPLVDKLKSFARLTRDRVFLMPEGATRVEMDKRRLMVMEMAQKWGFQFSPRLHIDTYDSKRGV